MIDASILGYQTLELDFSKPREAKEKAVWSNQQKLNLTAKGLGFDDDPAVSVELSLETREPVAIGVSWRPAQSASVYVEITPPKKPFVLPNGKTSEPYVGNFFVRYSPDAKHWSSWHSLALDAPETGQPPRWTYRGEMMVPRKERAAYEVLLRTHVRMEVPWGSDEEAAVKWILKTDPRFFEKHLPFIGYLQFLLETPLNGGQRIQSVKINVSYAVGGMATVPKDGAADPKRSSIPWRFKSE